MLSIYFLSICNFILNWMQSLVSEVGIAIFWWVRTSELVSHEKELVQFKEWTCDPIPEMNGFAHL